jgi:hypothetical protein
MTSAKEPTARSASGEGRSVNYPFVTLEVAAERARELWASVGTNKVPIPTAGAAWGYAEKSSGLRSTVSALKQYGLLQDIGEGGKRRVRLTDRAVDILIEAPDSPKHRDALKAAVLSPKIYREIFDRFPGGFPAQDHAISSFLLRERRFNRKSVTRFIAGLRADIQFAGVDRARAAPPPRTYQATAPSAASPARSDAPDENTREGGFNQDVYTLGSEGKVLLQWPEKISQESYDELSDWIELQLKKIARINGLKRHRI